MKKVVPFERNTKERYSDFKQLWTLAGENFQICRPVAPRNF